MANLTHIDASGRARMVDVSDKAATHRTARATGRIVVHATTLQMAMAGENKKGDVCAVAELAGIMAAKRTSELIPLCHPLALRSVRVVVEPDKGLPGYRVEATVKTLGETGVEMEALTAVSVACLTLYDMLKAADPHMRIEAIELAEKTGGASGDFRRDA